jgi:hypothetical protein
MYNSIALNAKIRKADNGRISIIETNIYMDSNGKMATFFSKPENIIIINNAKGQVSIYDKNNNTVAQSQSQHYSSKSNEIYYFINNKKADLGLAEIGFTIEDISYKDGLRITEWIPPMEGLKYFSKVKLVHDGENPIYLEYINQKEMIVKKTYFYNYEKINSLDLPKTITQIDFKTANDSIVSKTEFDNIRFDVPESKEKLNFKIPNDAKILK